MAFTKDKSITQISSVVSQSNKQIATAISSTPSESEDEVVMVKGNSAASYHY